MNSLTIIGNLTRDPELRSTPAGIPVCTFTVAVNRRKAGAEAGQPEADFFRVTAWRQLGELCSKYLAKGRKVCVIGSVAVNTFAGSDGTTRASLEVNADQVEFLTPRSEQGAAPGGYGQPQPAYQQAQADQHAGFVQVEDDSDLPF